MKRQFGRWRTGSRSCSLRTSTSNSPFDGRPNGASAPSSSSFGDVAGREAPAGGVELRRRCGPGRGGRGRARRGVCGRRPARRPRAGRRPGPCGAAARDREPGDDRRRAEQREGAGARRRQPVGRGARRAVGRRPCDAAVTAAGDRVDRGADCGSPPSSEIVCGRRSKRADLAAGERRERGARERPAEGAPRGAGLGVATTPVGGRRPAPAQVVVEPARGSTGSRCARWRGLLAAR